MMDTEWSHSWNLSLAIAPVTIPQQPGNPQTCTHQPTARSSLLTDPGQRAHMNRDQARITDDPASLRIES